ncbi:Nucleosome-binding_factor SPN [Hexamita inflata]|uniref:POB3 subunit n=1 Tax=Hexamita inflata TaxID=28002 RepID=A0ABP1GHD8_9EUKA
MNFTNMPARLMDAVQLPVSGKLSLHENMFVFNPSADEDPQHAIQKEVQDIKFVSFQNIGYRQEEGPFFEVTFYMKDAGSIFTFGDFLVSGKEDMGAFILNNYKMSPYEKELKMHGWTWGDLHVDSRVVALMDPADDDLSDQEEEEADAQVGENENQAENSDSESEPVDAEFFHFPTQLITDYQKLAAKDLTIEFQPSNVKNAVYVKQVTFGFPDGDQRDVCYSSLSKVVSSTKTERLLLLENFQLTQPAGKFHLEFGSNYFKFFSGKEIQRDGKDVVRIYLLEKDAETFFLVLQFLQSKKVNDSDMMIIELNSKRENRELMLPQDPEELQRLTEALQIPGYSEFLFSSSENFPYGKDALIEQSNNVEKKNCVRLRSVPQFVIVTKFMQYVCKNAQLILSDYAQSQLYSQQIQIKGFSQQHGEDTFSYVRCSYKRPQREYYLFLLNKSMLIMPVDVQHINFNDLQQISYEKDMKSSHGDISYIKMVILARGSRIELTKLVPDQVSNIISFIKRKNITNCKIIDEYRETGGRNYKENEAQDDDEEDDEDWDEEESEGSDGGYEYSSGSESGVSVEEVKKPVVEEKKKKETAKAQKNAFDYEEVEGVRPEDALRDVGMPNDWIGAVGTAAVDVEEITGDSD